ncbi:MAG: tRNA pseudouridine(55) synthase TruB [Clostridiales Family XIII bacterium]|jgi:tRNA pseudouridine55 synthase|nr:tRNA pseudouridine(55) synthase TruB [Clostridiales Family XIII bacterium]
MDFDGVINFLKPSGMTSHDAVAYMRRHLGMKRIGHTGTLDPMAAGVLPLCVGKGTRIVEYLIEDSKKYRCELRLGVTTDTLDIWGTETDRRESAAARLTEAEIMAAASAFAGAQRQKPPMYSAVKIGGKRLYEYARKGVEIEAPEREVYINNITVKRIDLASLAVLFDVECSKGTYIRSICAGIGEKLGCGAAMSGLVRLSSGFFGIEGSHTAEEIARLASEGRVGEILTPADKPLVNLGMAEIEEAEGSRRFVNGATVEAGSVAIAGEAGDREDAGGREGGHGCSEGGIAGADAARFSGYYRVYGPFGGEERRFLGIGRIKNGALCADKVMVGN